MTRYVWVVTYTHRHGTDFWVCATQEAAIRSCAETACEWISDIGYPEEGEKIAALFKAGKYQECINAYESATEEYFDMGERAVRDYD